MIYQMLYLILAVFSLALSVAVRHTTVFFVDFTRTPESVQLLASWGFVLLFGFFMILAGWSFYEE